MKYLLALLALSSCAPQIVQVVGHDQNDSIVHFEADYYGCVSDTLYFKKNGDQSRRPQPNYITIDTIYLYDIHNR